MRVKITINNNDKLSLNKRWIRTLLLVAGILFTFIALAQIFCIAVKPTGYEKVVFMLGDKYVQQLCFGILFFFCYYVIKKSTPVNSN